MFPGLSHSVQYYSGHAVSSSAALFNIFSDVGLLDHMVGLILIFKINYVSVCLFVYVYRVQAVPAETRRGCQVP